MKTPSQTSKDIKAFIIKRLALQGKEFNFTKVQRTKDIWFRYFATDINGKMHIFTVIKDSPESILQWYKDSNYDESLNRADRKALLAPEKIKEQLDSYFQQKFEVDGIDYYFRWS